jgi:hypothetical protein
VAYPFWKFWSFGRCVFCLYDLRNNNKPKKEGTHHGRLLLSETSSVIRKAAADVHGPWPSAIGTQLTVDDKRSTVFSSPTGRGDILRKRTPPMIPPFSRNSMYRETVVVSENTVLHPWGLASVPSRVLLQP